MPSLEDVFKDATTPANLPAIRETHVSEHALLSASSAKRWMPCPGSIRLIRDLPDVPSVYALEGTAAHEVAKLCLTENHDAIEFLGRTVLGFEVDEEMAEAVQLHLNTVRANYDPAAGDILYIETRFVLDDLNPPEKMFGTADVVIYKPYARKLIVIDFKYGVGIIVSAIDNAQGRYYGLGAALKLREHPVVEVEVVIVQPRAETAEGTVRSETVGAVQLLEWSSWLLERAAETQKPDAALVPGQHCRETFCPAAGFCPALRAYNEKIAQAEFDTLNPSRPALPPAEMLTPEQVKHVLEGSDLLAFWVKSVRAYAFQLFREGKPVPDWKIVDNRGRNKWIKDDPEIAAQLQIELELPEDHLWKPRKLKSPFQMSKGLKAPMKKALKAYYEKKSGGVTLARETDRRPAKDVSAALEFADEGSYAAEKDED
jgi:hypothetical protein